MDSQNAQDVQDEVVIINDSNKNDNDNVILGGQSIVKGKRTKRQRPQSPIPFRMITANSSKSDEGSDICSNNNDVIDDGVTTTTTLSEEEEVAYYVGGTTTASMSVSVSEEEEEMANCLILLAQGQPAKPEKEQRALSLFDTGLDANVKYSVQAPVTKFTSRKFMETPTTTGKSGYYVYECKTCGKTFASFQALGGHRASHKKPKNNRDDDHSSAIKRRGSNTNLLSINSSNNNTLVISSDEEDLTFMKKVIKQNHNNNSASSLSLQLTNRALYQGNNFTGKARVHECSICGAEFSSGQALGGHMRRHRGPVNGAAVAATPISALVPVAVEEASIGRDPRHIEDMLVHMNMPPPRNTVTNTNTNTNTNTSNNTSMLSLDLDLNLPAPAEDQRETKFVFESKAPQQEQQQEREREQEQEQEREREQQALPPLSPPKQNHPQQSQQIVFSAPALVDCHYQF